MSTLAVSWLDRHFVSALTLDDQGVAHLESSETIADGDPVVTVHAKLGHQTTADATPVTIDLFTVGDGDVWGVDVVVTAKGVGKRALVKLSALVWGDGSTATLEGTVTSDAKGNDVAIAADIIVTGSTVQLELTGWAGDLTWGFETRGQVL